MTELPARAEFHALAIRARSNTESARQEVEHKYHAAADAIENTVALLEQEVATLKPWAGKFAELVRATGSVYGDHLDRIIGLATRVRDAMHDAHRLVDEATTAPVPPLDKAGQEGVAAVARELEQPF